MPQWRASVLLSALLSFEGVRQLGGDLAGCAFHAARGLVFRELVEAPQHVVGFAVHQKNVAAAFLSLHTGASEGPPTVFRLVFVGGLLDAVDFRETLLEALP